MVSLDSGHVQTGEKDDNRKTRENTHPVRSLDVGSRVCLDAESLDDLLLRTEETEGKQYQVRGIELMISMNSSTSSCSGSEIA